MKRFIISLIMCLLLTGVAANAADKVDNPKPLKQCGMDRD